MKSSNLYKALLVAPLMVLPGCWSCGDSCKKDDKVAPEAQKNSGNSQTAAVSDGSKVLVKMGNKAVITEKMLEDKLEELIKENPQFAAMVQFMPIKNNLLQAMVNDLMFTEYVEREGITKTAEYQADRKKLMSSVDSMLNGKYFAQRHQAAVSDADVRKFYDDKKDEIPALVVSRGGCKTKTVACKDEKSAQELMAKAQETKNLMQAAKAAHMADQVKDLNYVNAESMDVEESVRKVAMNAKSFPAFSVVKGQEGYMVVGVEEKKETQYRDFAEIQDQLKQYLAKQEEGKKIQDEVERLKSAWNVEVTVNEDYFKPAAQIEETTAQKVAPAKEEGKVAAKPAAKAATVKTA